MGVALPARMQSELRKTQEGYIVLKPTNRNSLCVESHITGQTLRMSLLEITAGPANTRPDPHRRRSLPLRRSLGARRRRRPPERVRSLS